MGVLTHVMQGWTAADVFGICGGRREILVKAWTGPAVSAPQGGETWGWAPPGAASLGTRFPVAKNPGKIPKGLPKSFLERQAERSERRGGGMSLPG